MVASRFSYPASQFLLWEPLYRLLRRRCGGRVAADHGNGTALGVVAPVADPAGACRCDPAYGAVCGGHGRRRNRSQAALTPRGEVSASAGATADGLGRGSGPTHQGRRGVRPGRCRPCRTASGRRGRAFRRPRTWAFLPRRHGVSLVSVRGGDEGRVLIEQADAWMRAQSIRNPARMAACLVPGFARA